MRNKYLFASVLMLSAFSAGFHSAAASAHMKGMYKSKAEAERRAAELKCDGVFQMGDMWMPCVSERALHDALQRQ
jgi:hypothetical protein